MARSDEVFDPNERLASDLVIQPEDHAVDEPSVVEPPVDDNHESADDEPAETGTAVPDALQPGVEIR